MKQTLIKKSLALLLALIMVFSLLPATAQAAGDTDTVTVQISNPSAYNVADGAPFDGALDLNGEAEGTAATVPINAGDTAMDAIASALTTAGYTAGSYDANGYNIAYSGTYLDSINGLTAKAASIADFIHSTDFNHDYDGWCGVINDISPAVGFSSIYVSAGDVIRLEYSLDLSVTGTTGSGSANNGDSGFAFSVGTLSSTGSAADYDLALTLTLPASTTSVAITATPCTKEPVVVYDATGVPHALNSDISVDDGDKIQIVGGDYEEVFTVNVNLIGVDDIDTLLKNIAAGYTGSSDQWTVIDMAAYRALDPDASSVTSTAAVQALIDNAIGRAKAAAPAEGDIAKDIVALQSVGIDPGTLYPHGEAINLFDALDNTSHSIIHDVAAITLHAYRQGDTLTQDQVSAMFDVIEDYKNVDDNYIYDFWKWGGDEVDTPAQILTTVAPFASASVDTYGVKTRAIEIRDAIIGELDALTQSSSGSLGNANTDAMVIIGLAAAGIDAGTDSRFKAESGLSLVDGLLSYALTDLSGFVGWNNQKNPMATEQGFRALIAAKEISRSSAAYDIYDFSGNAVVPGYGSEWIASPVHFALIPDGASVSVNGQTAVTPGVYDLVAGTYEYTVSKSGYASKTGYLTVSDAEASNHTTKTINISLASIPDSDSDITVSVKVKMHPSGTLAGTYTYKNNASAYTNTIASQSVSLKAGSTVFDALDAALTVAEVNYIETSSGYIGTIDDISEMDYGPYSGWLYMVNGTTANQGSREYKLASHASVVWFYSDDYTKEYGSEKWTGDTLLADGSTLTPSTDLSGNKASASVTALQLKNAANAAVKDGDKAVTVTLKNIEDAKSTIVSLPKSAIEDLATSGLALVIETPVGRVTIPDEALASVASQASSGTISVAIESVEKNVLALDQQKLVGDNPVFDISITSDDKAISSFDGENITISLPYTLKTGETAGGVTVWYLSDDGKLEPMNCTYDKATGLATFITTHLSIYVVGHDAWTNPFSDIKSGDWHYDAVNYAVQNELFTGISSTAFSPNTPMTRSMLVTVLHRLEGKPAVTAANSFSDVVANQWYTEAVVWANAKSIINGYGNGKFGTNDPITREQMALILHRYAQYKGYDVSKTTTLNTYTDALSISSYSQTAMKWANAEGIITGREVTTLAPMGTATRAEVASILMRFTKNMVI